jgi:hypothetical protein
VSHESPVTCEKRPIVVFNSKKWDKEDRGRWAGVCAFDLDTKELIVCVTEESLAISEPHLRAWVIDIVFLSDDGQKAYLNLAIEKEAPGGGIVHHHLASLDLAEKKLELLSPLKDTRF